MKYDLRRPCDNCPFRTKPRFRFRETRAREIAESLERGEFPCHKTLDYSDGDGPRETKGTQHCAGALIMRVHMDDFGQMMRIVYRLSLFDPTRLDMNAPVYTSAEDFIAGTSS